MTQAELTKLSIEYFPSCKVSLNLEGFYNEIHVFFVIDGITVLRLISSFFN